MCKRLKLSDVAQACVGNFLGSLAQDSRCDDASVVRMGVSLAIHLSLSLNHNAEATVTALTGALHALAKAATGAQ
jgi:hypothetical protein